MGSKTKFTRQYYKFIRKGALRIDAVSNNTAFDPLAFINTNGKYVVVVNAGASGSFSLQGLPVGTYGIFYTTATQYDINLSDITISSGQALNTNIPASGVLTVYAKSGGASDTTSPSIPSGLSAISVSSSQIDLSWTISTDNVGVSGYNIYRKLFKRLT